jgi:putative transposase
VNREQHGREGGWRDNVFIEWLWRSVSEARVSPRRRLAFCNQQRPHSSLDGRTPDEACFEKSETAMAA